MTRSRTQLQTPDTQSAIAEPSLDYSLTALLYSICRSMDQPLNERLAEIDLSRRQLEVLTAVGVAGEASQSQISRATGIDASTLMNVARKLEKRQLITRPRSRRDARARRVRLTAAGELALAAGRRSLDEIELLFEQALGAARLTELRTVLKSLQERTL